MLIDRMLQVRGRNSVCITKVKGHADEAMVRCGMVRELDRVGNDAADEAADFGRRRVDYQVIDARRNYAGLCKCWYPVVRDLHRFFIAISRAAVNADDGGVLLLILWFGRLAPSLRGVGSCRLLGVRRFYLVLKGFGRGSGFVFPPLSFLLRMPRSGPARLGFWSSGSLFFGLCGVSFLELLILYEQWAVERLPLAKGCSSLKEAWAPNFSVGCSVWSRH